MNIQNTPYMGIDPGEVNLGYAILNQDYTKFTSGVINTRTTGFFETVTELSSMMRKFGVTHLGLERYVAYQGKLTKSNEPVLMLTGAINFVAQSGLISPAMPRAIDWKPAVCKNLFKTKDFRNPSKANKFDKEYSMAAATCICGETPNTDHEADAICLAYYTGEIIQ